MPTILSSSVSFSFTGFTYADGADWEHDSPAQKVLLQESAQYALQQSCVEFYAIAQRTLHSQRDVPLPLASLSSDLLPLEHHLLEPCCVKHWHLNHDPNEHLAGCSALSLALACGRHGFAIF